MCTRRPEITKVLFPIAIFRASHVGDVDRFGDVIRYNCKRGERFMDGTTTKWIKCNASGLWNDTDSDNCASRTPFRPSSHSLLKRLTLYPWQTCTSERHFNFSGKHPTTLHLMREDYSCIHIHHCQ